MQLDRKLHKRKQIRNSTSEIVRITYAQLHDVFWRRFSSSYKLRAAFWKKCLSFDYEGFDPTQTLSEYSKKPNNEKERSGKADRSTGLHKDKY